MNIEGVSLGHNLKAIQELHNHVDSHVRSLQSLGVPSTSFGAMLASVIMNKLPHELHLAVSKEITDGEWNLEQVITIVEKEIDAIERAAANTKRVQKGAGRGHPPTASAFCPAVVLLHTVAKEEWKVFCVPAERTPREGLSIIQELSQLRRKTLCQYLF